MASATPAFRAVARNEIIAAHELLNDRKAGFNTAVCILPVSSDSECRGDLLAGFAAVSPSNNTGVIMVAKHRSRMTKLLATVIVSVLVAPDLGWTQQPSQLPTAGEIQERLKKLDSATGLDDSTKSRIRDLLQQTLLEADSIAKWTGESAQNRQTAEQATVTIESARHDLDKLRSAKPAELPEDLSVAELNERLASRESELTQLSLAAKAAEQESNRRNARRLKIARLLADLRKNVIAVTAQMQAAAPAAEPPELTAARRTYLRVHLAAVRSQSEALETERAAFDATVELLPVRRRATALALELAQRELDRLRSAIALRQHEDVQRQLRNAELVLRTADVGAQSLGEEAVRFAKQRVEIRQRLDSVNERRVALRRQLEQLRAEALRTRDQIKNTGLTSAIGQLLRRQRFEMLPDQKELRNEIDRRQVEIQVLQQTMFELEDRQRQLEGLGGAASAQSAIGEAVDLRLENLDLLITDTQTCFYKLVDLDAIERELQAEAESYARFIQENVLWIRGASAFQLADAGHAAHALLGLFDLDGWLSVGQVLAYDFRSLPALSMGAVAIFLLVLYFRRRSDCMIVELGQRAMSASELRFTPTLLVFFLTLLSATPWPAMMLYLSWRLRVASTSLDRSYALGEALWQTAVPLFLLLLARQACRARGLAGAHFGWTSGDLAPLRRWLRLLMVFALPLVFVIALFHTEPNPLWRYSLGRGSLVLLGLVVALFAHWLLRPGRGILYQVSTVARESWIHRARYLSYFVATAIPLILAGLAIAGFYVAAFRLGECVLFSAMLLFGLLLVGSLLFRWVLVTRRWLAVQQSQSGRQLNRVAESEFEAPVTDPEPPANLASPLALRLEPPLSTGVVPEVDLAQIASQTRRFLWTLVAAAALAGLWAIWIDVVPAVGVLDQVELWSTSVQTTETIETATGSVITREFPLVESLTLADLIVVTVVVVMTVVAGRNLPGLMEMGLWQRLPLDAGARFAVTTTTRYAIYIVGTLYVVNMLGFAWEKVGWLVAALTVGLGFGLQEIFANFVSGLIVLAERPLRVGDLVTIGKINGTVARIQMRATTIRDWNQRELVVPNKALVTENLINWTLSDSNYRVDLVIGIAYGSDTEKAREILLKIAADHPKILKQPRPKAIFRAFGNSSLEIEYRVYIPHMDYWPRVVTQVNTAIDREFKQAGIVIAFPQQDIHIRSIAGAMPFGDARPVRADERAEKPVEAS